jgi:GNAT superfamily N-acetyltransferase
MRELTRDVWEGSDYVPYVWDEWLRDASGWLMVASLGGRVVGLQHIERQEDGSAWVEGIRVAADVRDRGIGGAMLRRAVQWAQEHACPWIRLATSSENPASNRIAKRNGLVLLGTFASQQTDPRAGGRDGAHVASPVEYAQVRDFLAASLGDDPSRWVHTEAWTAHSLTEQRLRTLLAMESVVVCGSGPDAVAIATMNVARPSLRIGFLRGTPEGMERLCLWLRASAADNGVSVLRANVLSDSDTLSALAASGFRSRHGHAMLLHGLDLRAGYRPQP